MHAFITSTGHGEPAITPVRRLDRSNSSKRSCAELGDEHRRHAVQRRAPLGLDRLEHRQRVECVARDHDRGTVGRAPEVADHHAEAVVEGHGDAHPVVVR